MTRFVIAPQAMSTDDLTRVYNALRAQSAAMYAAQMDTTVIEAEIEEYEVELQQRG
jgi:hypothetical protein